MIRSLAVVAGLCLSAESWAQQPERGTFYLLAGADTMAAERFTRTAARLDGELVDRAANVRIAYAAELQADGTVPTLTLRVFRPATDTTPLQTATVRFEGTTAVIETPGGPQSVPTQVGAVPFLNASGAFMEQILLRARAMGGSPATVPIFITGGAQTAPLSVTWMPPDSVTMGLGGIVVRARVSASGRILGGIIPAQNVAIVRGAAADALPAVPRDYSAPRGAPYVAEDVTLRTPAGITLAGTLTLPRDRRGGVPAVVTISGSGPQDRDGESPALPGIRLFRQVADTLGRRGVAVLRLDDRGVGRSDRGPETVTSADFANDVRAAVAYLRGRPEIDGSRIMLLGHSEGAIIAPMVAATDARLGGIILMAGNASPGRAILEYQQRYVVDSVFRLVGPARDSALAQYARNTDSVIAAMAWMRFFAEHDAAATARRVRVPVLILHGETDRQVPVSEAHGLAAALRAGGNRRVTLRTFPATNHLFVEDANGSFTAYTTLPSREIRPAVLGSIADWVAATRP